jgi:tetratricopeptide (TPR) repeat protein
MRWLVFLILSGIFLISPYFKGLYYNNSLYGISITLFFLFIILAFRLAIKKEFISIQRVIPIMVMPVCYLLPSFSAENSKGAFDSIILWTAYSSFFVLLYWSACHKRIKSFLPFIFQLTGSWIAIFTLLVFYHVIDFRSAMVAGRFASVFQYPNTFGMFMAVFILYSLVMLTRGEISLLPLLSFSFPLIPFIVCFIESFSRGMFLIFPICWFLGFFLFNLTKQIEYTLYTVIFYSLSLIVYISIKHGEEILSPLPGLSSLLFCTLSSILLVYLLKKFIFKKKINFLNKLQNRKWHRFSIPLILIFLLILIGIDLKNSGLLYQQLPEQLQTRINTTNLKASTAKERLIFSEDALLISKKSPIIGLGGETWASIYKSYQQFPYISNKVHNGYLEMLVDTGLIGFVSFISIFLYFYWQIFKKYKQNEENTLQIAVIISSSAIIIHSYVDFNFSYSFVWLTLFWLLVMGFASEPPKKTSEVKQFKHISKIAIPLFSLVIAISSYLCFRFILAEQQFNEFKKANSLFSKEETIKNAIAYDTNNSTYRLNYIELTLNKYRLTKTESVKETLLTAISELAGIEPNNSSIILKAGAYSESMGEDELAIKYFNSGLALDKFNKQLYENSIRLKVIKATNLLKQGEHSEAENLLKSAIKDYQDNKYWLDSFNKRAPENPERFNSRNFLVTDQSHYYASLAYLNLKEYGKALSTAENMDDRTIQKKKLYALIVLEIEKSGNNNKAEDLTTKFEKKYPGFNSTLDRIRKNSNSI